MCPTFGKQNSMKGTLYLVSTPIGNLQDISPRAVDLLKTADLIACEDTRHTRKLLSHLGIRRSLVSYHEHNEPERAARLGRALAEGMSVALVSDAGTPGISDPGLRLVREAIAVGARVVPIPGPVAFVSALVVSGLPTDSVFFGGFLPSKKSERRKRLASVKPIPATLVFYETPHRLADSLADCIDILGDRPAAVARELTKLHEEIVRGMLSDLKKRFSSAKPRGEFVLVIDRESTDASVNEATAGSLPERVKKLESEGLDRRSALKQAAREFGLSRSEAYRLLHASQGE